MTASPLKLFVPYLSLEAEIGLEESILDGFHYPADAVSTGFTDGRSGHQNHLPSNAATDGRRNVRTMNVSSKSPIPMKRPDACVFPPLALSKANIVSPKTIPAVVTTVPVLANDRIIPMRSPARDSSFMREVSRRL